MFERVLPPVAWQAGVTCLVSHAALHVLFVYVLPAGPWKTLAGPTAHQCVCFPLMVYLMYQGCLAWFFENPSIASTTLHGRAFDISQRGMDMGLFVWGMLLLWDIPASLLTKSLREPIIIAHHCGMLVIAGVVGGILTPPTTPIFTYYASFFLGVIECSSIFLAIVDMFHPKYKSWHAWLQETDSRVGTVYREHIHEALRRCFAVSFLMIRAVYFPILMVRCCLADFWNTAMLPVEERHGISKVPFLTVFVFALLFTFLQLHWGMLIMKQVIKTFFGGSKKDKETPSKKQK